MSVLAQGAGRFRQRGKAPHGQVRAGEGHQERNDVGYFLVVHDTAEAADELVQRIRTVLEETETGQTARHLESEAALVIEVAQLGHFGRDWRDLIGLAEPQSGDHEVTLALGARDVVNENSGTGVRESGN